MKVVILCGGKGTRLREETEYRPKPMVPIGAKPILWHIMKIYASYGFKEFILCLGYKGEIIKDYFRNYMWMTNDVTVGPGGRVLFHGDCAESDWVVTLADTGEETLTAGRIDRIKPYLQGDSDFLLTYGDGVGDVNILDVIQAHKKHNGVLTLTAVRPPGRFGELEIDSEGYVTEFNEKPQVAVGRINGGFFVVNSSVFDYLHGGDDVMLEQRPMQRLAAEHKLVAYTHNGFWQPMDTYQEYKLLNKMWSENKAPWKIW